MTAVYLLLHELNFTESNQMENLYKRQFPTLMAGKTVMYVHGFMSSAQSGTVAMLQALMPNARIMAEDMPIHPSEAVALLKKLCEDRRPDLIIGTSMGGMYTEMLKGYDRIVVNPAFRMGETMHKRNMMGKQTFLNPRKDGKTEIIVTKALVNEYKEITARCFSAITPAERTRVYGLFGDKDPIVHTFDLFREHYPNAIRFHGAHQLTDKVALHYLVPVIRWIDDRQDNRERPIVYIDYDTMHDHDHKAASSMHKAYEMLIEHYQVFVVAPAPTNGHTTITAVQEWCEQYLSTPAHDRLIFTNQKQLLYGDYLITSQPQTLFMGTILAYGSDELKTWEDLIVYFSRLDGQ